MPEYKLTKLEAARRQIETAVRLYFHGGDAISIHTLAAAGRNVVVNLCSHRGSTSPLMLDYMINVFIKPEHHKTVLNAFRAPENFFKHSDRDPDGVISFNPESTDFLLLEAVDCYATLTGEIPASFAAFRMWWLIHHPDLMKDPPAILLSNFKRPKYGDHQKADFYADAMARVAKAKVDPTVKTTLKLI